jgi:hypothetical protein
MAEQHQRSVSVGLVYSLTCVFLLVAELFLRFCAEIVAQSGRVSAFKEKVGQAPFRVV